MDPYTPDLTPTTYKPMTGALGDIENPMNLLYYCSDCNYYSAQKPVEVPLA